MRLTTAAAALAVALSAVGATPSQYVFNAHRHGGSTSKPATAQAPGRSANPAMVDMDQWTSVTTMDAIPNYQLRIKSPQLCDANVTQYSGYLDTAEDKHFFFWFF